MTSAEARPAVARVDEGAAKLGQVIRTPSVGATITGTVVLGAATLFGVLETTVAAGAAYVAYRLFKKKHLHGREKEE